VALPDLEKTQSVINRYFSEWELVEIVSMLYHLHRIQGSKDLEKSADVIAELLERAKIEVRIHEYPYSEARGTMPPLVGWDVEFGEAKLVKPREETISSFNTAKTAVVAHSPPGEVEGEVVYIPTIDSAKSADVQDKIVLTPLSPRYAYFKCLSRGARGFLFYRKNAPSNAIPYLGLFLKPEQAKQASAPAIAIPRAWAQKLVEMIERGERPIVRILVKSSFRFDAKIRVVEARIGDSVEEVHGVAHICHPGGTVNDNISGAATLLELVLALSRAIDRRDLEIPKQMSLVFVWVPEYSGTLPYLGEVLSQGRKPLFAINLDMVGEKQCVTNSTLIFIRSPKLLKNPFEAIVYASLLKSLKSMKTFGNVAPILEHRFDISPYTSGSDHDIYLLFGIPAVMLNQWPDRFYHTHLDSIDKLDPTICRKIGVAVGAAMYVIASLSSEELTKEFARIIEGYEKIVQGIDTLTKLDKTAKSKRRENNTHEVLYRYVGEGLPSMRYFEEVLDEESFEKLVKLLEKDGLYPHLLFAYIPIILSRRPMRFREIIECIRDEYGDVDEDRVREIIDFLAKAKLLKVVMQ